MLRCQKSQQTSPKCDIHNFSLLVVVMFWEVTGDSELTHTEPLLLEEIHGPGWQAACHNSFVDASVHNLMCVYLICAVDYLTLNSQPTALYPRLE